MCLVEIAAAAGRAPAMMLDILAWDAEHERLRAGEEAEAPAGLPARLRAEGMEVLGDTSAHVDEARAATCRSSCS